jgi:hypothetical protein
MKDEGGMRLISVISDGARECIVCCLLRYALTYSILAMIPAFLSSLVTKQ